MRGECAAAMVALVKTNHYANNQSNQNTGLELPVWQRTRRYSLTGAVALASLIPQLPTWANTPGALPESYAWQKVVNNFDLVPGTDSKPFNSYNQPSVNASGLIVFRARSKGPEVMSGITGGI